MSLEVSDTLQVDSASVNQPLNEVRFGNWGRHEYLNNDYILELRRYLDKVAVGEEKSESLAPYTDLIRGKFVIIESQPAMLGGLMLTYLFVDRPNLSFTTQVYSYVGDDNSISGYEVRSTLVEENDYGVTVDEVKAAVQADPDLNFF